MLAATLEYSTPRETDRATVTSTLLTQIDDALTAAAIVIGGAFAYLKFIKGRHIAIVPQHSWAQWLAGAPATSILIPFPGRSLTVVPQ